MTIFKNEKEISRQEAEALIGKDRMDKRIEDAKQTHTEDPNTEISWMDGMRIEFE